MKKPAIGSRATAPTTPAVPVVPLKIAVEPLLEVLNEHVQQHLASFGKPEADFANAE
ncbi:hypothetical protein IFR23_13340 [Sphingomonas sp. CFBP 13603]|uniref:hypothetical protein n=1 Tax=Sphingomonas sp. CFBP 13603 TaxID=2774040 RepID=UPI001867D882|nr:hypothetical protein [Sphingomonas sp. CFBP 13603]MBE2992992.1 hypothetical protein [Sphingomonas sp. CFBP 13603]